MTDAISLTMAHWMYLAGIVAIIVTMIFRTTVVVPAVAATFLVALSYSGDLISGLTSVFNASLVAAGQLFNIFLIIALMTSLLGALRALGSDVRMILPFQRVMTNGHIAFIGLAIVTYLISLFFWPTPAVPLVGAILIPAAIAAGLPAMGAVVAIAIAGQGMALSSDYIIRVAPGISAKAAGVDIALVSDRAFVLSIMTGLIALALGYLAVRKYIAKPDPAHLKAWEAGQAVGQPGAKSREGTFPDKSILAKSAEANEKPALNDEIAAEAASLLALPTNAERWSRLFALVVPLAFGAIIAYMVLAKFSGVLPQIQGGEGAALVGGVAALILLFATLAGSGKRFLTDCSDHVTDGLVFAFKAMGSVLPIAGFFFIGNSETAGAILGLGGDAQAPGFLFDLVQAGRHAIPDNSFLVAFGLLLMGMITGADGSGFSGLPLTGALAGALGHSSGTDAATLASIGQMGAIWTGGGTLIAWSSLIAVAGFARVPVLDAVRVLFVPVMSGLVISTLIAVLIW